MIVNLLMAQLMLEIWSPAKCGHYPMKIRKQQELFYKTKGIVLHDRELNRK